MGDVINTSLDISSLLGETEAGETKKKRMEKPLTLTINPFTEEDVGLDQATSYLVKKKSGKVDTVEIMVEEKKEDLGKGWRRGRGTL